MYMNNNGPWGFGILAPLLCQIFLKEPISRFWGRVGGEGDVIVGQVVHPWQFGIKWVKGDLWVWNMNLVMWGH